MEKTGISRENRSLSLVAVELAAVSFIVLFQELALIRWVAGQVRVIAYFPNLILLSAFLGLGLGCLRSGNKPLLWLWPVSLLVLTVTAFFMGRIVFTQESYSEHLWLLYYDLPKSSIEIPSIKIPIIIFFILSAISFIPLGQVIGRKIRVFSSFSRPLAGYMYNILGSLAGVAGFSLISLFGVFPKYWFAAILISGITLFLHEKKALIWYLIFSVLIFLSVLKAEKADAYSPYYALSYRTGNKIFDVLTNGSLHQTAVDLSMKKDGWDKRSETVKKIVTGYHLPYMCLEKSPEEALVLGSGTGNDIAALLEHGVGHIDAVEIDPVIIDWGRQYHPDKPYSSGKVTVYNTDARAFLNTTAKKYDLIVFGTLDSQTQLSALSNVRLDNFVYTMEGIKAAKERLAENGGMIMYFMVGKQFILQRIIALSAEIFGETPVIYFNDHILFNTVFMSGPAFDRLRDEKDAAFNDKFKKDFLPFIELPTDDWPYLYLAEKKISGFYLQIMVIIGALSAAGIFFLSRSFRAAITDRRKIDYEMFLFGAGFLLFETRAVTEMNLVWGTTWITSAVVFGSVLTMILLATLVMQRYFLSFRASIIGLGISSYIVYMLPVNLILGEPVAVKLLCSLFMVGMPVFFASLCFTRLFAESISVDTAFGWNLLGSVCGGLIEYSSMILGFKILLFVALAAYLAAFLIYINRGKNRIGEKAETV
ncbi:hypothetical protein M0R36_04785 [bacterium]|nr:hypothetical protein [bacterium]